MLVALRQPIDSSRLKIVITALTWLAYPFLFFFLTPIAGNSIGAVGFLPVLLTSWLWGLKKGVLIVLVGNLMTPVLYFTVVDTNLTFGSLLIPNLIVLGAAIACGYFSDLKRQLEDQNMLISRQADHDALTGLLNRFSLTRELRCSIQEARDANNQLGVLFIDLDRFKVINDTLGHETGDALLKTVAHKLAEVTRHHDLIARLGGDEFVVVLKELKQVGDSVAVAQELLEILAQPYKLNGKTVMVQASIGISLFPDDGDTVDELLNRADNAMYKVKWQGKNGVHRFGCEGYGDSRRLQLSRDFAEAFEAGSLSLAYQPIVRFSDTTLIGLEALLRWQHPEFGPVSPLEILSIAADLGLDKSLGAWVLETACRQSLSRIALAATPVSLHVNLSPNHLNDPLYVKGIGESLERTGFPADNLVLEITEDTFLTHQEEALNNLNILRQLGIRIAIDDFGTGYSSLTRLRTLPIDILKLDRSFIDSSDFETAAEAMSLVEAVIWMGHSLGKQVVVEGIETAEQFSRLAAISCDGAQGYFIAKPASIEALSCLVPAHGPRLAAPATVSFGKN